MSMNFFLGGLKGAEKCSRAEKWLRERHTFVFRQQGADWESLMSAPSHHRTGVSTEMDSILTTQATAHGPTLASCFQVTCLLEIPFMQMAITLV